MCNINIVIRSKISQNPADFFAFLQNVTACSFMSNSDGEGFYANGITVKSKTKINYLAYYKHIASAPIIMTHQRLATSGFSNEFTHPFENEEFVLVHNGIINDFLAGNGSDTHGFFLKFCQTFKHETGNRESAIVSSAKKLLDNLSGGSYSIAILDKKSNSLYYFKDSSTSMYFGKSKHAFYMTTSKANLKYFSFDGSFKERKVVDYAIYRITSDLNPRIIGMIKEKKFSVSVWDYSKSKAEDSYYGYLWNRSEHISEDW